MINTSITLSPEEEKKLNKMCTQFGNNKSAMIRKLIADFDSDMSSFEKKKMKILEELAERFKSEIELGKKEREYGRKAIVALLGNKTLEIAQIEKQTDPAFVQWLLQ